MELIKRLYPITLIIIIALVAYGMGIMEYLKWDEFKSHYDFIMNWVHRHFWESSAVFVSTYIFITACSIPVALLMTFLAGVLFPQPYSTLYADFGMTFGGCIAFLAAKSAVGEPMGRDTNWFIHKTKEGFKENAFAYMLFLKDGPYFSLPACEFGSRIPERAF